MRTSRIPYDLEAEFRAMQSARRRTRFLAFIGSSVFASLVGISIGALIANGAGLLLVVGITAWGCWGLNHILTRH